MTTTSGSTADSVVSEDRPTTAEVDLVLYEVDDGVALFRLNRPEGRNGWSHQMERRYFQLLAEADQDDSVRAAVVTGTGRAFCPGMDMSRLSSVAGQPMEVGGRAPQYTPRLFRKPLIAAINGACAGVGLVQAMQCDVRFAARGAKFSTSFARRGLGAEYNMSWVLPRYVGVENALDLLLSGRTFDADEAKELRLVSRVVAPEDVVAAATAYARDLAKNCSPKAMAVIRHQVLADLDRTFEASLYGAYAVMDALVQDADFAEGVASYLEKRPPEFAPLSDDFDPEGLVGAPVSGARLTARELLGR